MHAKSPGLHEADEFFHSPRNVANLPEPTLLARRAASLVGVAPQKDSQRGGVLYAAKELVRQE